MVKIKKVVRFNFELNYHATDTFGVSEQFLWLQIHYRLPAFVSSSVML